MRAFIALEPPQTFCDDVAALARQLQGYIQQGRFVDRANYHVTLAFLGEIDEAEAAHAVDVLDEAAIIRRPIELVHEGLGTFGRPADCTLWLGLEPSPELSDLAALVRRGLKRRRVAFDAKEFRPHVTLARRVRLPRVPLDGLVFPRPQVATRVTLFKSALTQEGAIYKPLHTVSVG